MIINDDWKVESDPLNIIVMRKMSKDDPRSKADAPDSWEPHYFGTVAGALDYIVQREIRGTGLKDLREVNKKLESISADVHKALGLLNSIPTNV